MLPGAVLNPLERDFLDASLAQRAGELESERRGVRRLRRLLAVTAVVAALAVIAGAVAFQAQQVAQASEAEGDIDRLLADARNADPTAPTIGILQALAAHQIEPSDTTLSALHWALTARPEHLGTLASGTIGHVITELGDGRSVVTHTTSTLDVWNVAERTLTQSIPLPGGPYPVEFALASHATADGRTGVVTTPTQTFVIDLVSGESLASFDHAGEGRTVMIDPTSTVVAIGFVDGAVEIRTLADLSLVAEFQATAGVAQFGWSPDGETLIVGGGDGAVAAWERRSEAIVWATPGTGWVSLFTAAAVLFDPGGSEVVVSQPHNGRRVLRLLDAATGEEVAGSEVIATPQVWLAMRWRGDGSNEIVGTTPFGQLGIIDIDRGETEMLPRVAATGTALAVLPELDVLLAVGRTGIDIRALDRSGPLQRTIPVTSERARLAESEEQLIAFDTESDRVVTGITGSGLAEVFDMADDDLAPQAYDVLAEGRRTIFADGFGEYVVVSSSGPAITVHWGIDGPPLGPAITPLGGVVSVAGSPAGDRLVISYGSVAVLYDVATGEAIRQLDPPPNLWNDYLPIYAQFSPDGEVVAQRSFYGISLHDAATGDILVRSDEHRLVTPGPSGEWVLTSDPEGDLQVRDPETLDAIGPPMSGHAGLATWVEIAPDNEHLASWGRDETVRVWTLDNRSQFGRPMIHSINGQRAQWSPEGDLLAVPTANGYQLWNFDTDTWPDIACEVAGRNMTRAEWEQFGPRTVDYRPICDQFPLPE